MEQTDKNTQNIQSDVIDLRELFAVLKKRKILISSITVLITLLAIIYALTVTRLWKAESTIEIGKYMDLQANKEVYIDNGSEVTERLQIKYIDIFKNVKDRNVTIESITTSKENPQFISIIALGKNNELVISEIQKIIAVLQNKHNIIIDEIINNKKAELAEADRGIFQIKHSKMQEIIDKIDFHNKVGLPAINQKIITVQSNLQEYMTQKDEAIKNLASIQEEASLAAIRLAEIQGLEYKISANKIQLIDLNTKKLNISSTILPLLTRGLEKLENIDIAQLTEKRELILLSMQPHNYHMTEVVGKIITLEHPVKPKKKLIVIVAFITGLMLSVFLAFFLEFIGNMRKEEE